MSLSALLTSLLALLVLCGCNAPYGPDEFHGRGCLKCHVVTIDDAHDIGCITCHQGHPGAVTVERAHDGLVSRPASPGNMKKYCGGCHASRVNHAAGSSHFTLEHETGAVWQAFFPSASRPAPADLRREEYPWSLQGLVADMLRRRCLLCHVYYAGDDYSGTRRGTGCAACHLDTAAGSMPLDHRFSARVDDRRCLACHYGNFVGWDFYGRFEKDYPADFRAPLSKGRHIPRPYGVEWLDMTPDVHRAGGMSCTSCHAPGPCGARDEALACTSCHDAQDLDGGEGVHAPGVLMRVSCTVCHAVWAPVDAGRSLMRQDMPDYEEWLRLSVQGSSEVEELCRQQGLAPFDRWSPAYMLDKIAGNPGPGIWFQGFVARRFWPVVIAETTDGRLVNARPLLDLSLSYLNGDDMIMADNIKPSGKSCVRAGRHGSCIKCIRTEFFPGRSWIGFIEPELLNNKVAWLEFVPHTVGPADIFRTRRAMRWVENMSDAE